MSKSNALQFIRHYALVAEKRAILPYSFVKKAKLIPLEETENAFVVAVCKDTEYEYQKEAKLLLEKNLEILTFSIEDIDAGIEHIYNEAEGEKSAFISALKEQEESVFESDELDLLEAVSDSPIIRLLNIIFSEAIEQGASDIHFEPTEEGLLVRYRVDGILQTRHSPPKEIQTQLLTRVKVLAKLDIAEKRLPQDGRIKLNLGGRTIDFRVSTIPVVYGERIVLRILDKGNVTLGLGSISMEEGVLQSFRRALRSSQGIILVTGPTGSGKTTTLYSALSELDSEKLNIMTIEDPVEYKIPKIAQIAVNHKIKLTFAVGLRHILRQDPDIVMVGEIRDRETAEIAIQASLTGHLVLSTLHTNDAPSAISRLVDMGIEPYLLSSSLIAVIAQRLVRKICPHCKEGYTPSLQEVEDLNLAAHGEYTFYRGKGCSECFDSGYSGRVGIYEYMPVSPNLQETLLRNIDASTIEKVAKQEGMSSLLTQGAEKVLKGQTTVFEVIRVCR